MQRLLQLIYNYRAFLFFLLMETIALFIFFSYSVYQGSSWFNTSTYAVGEILYTKKNVNNYFHLREENEELAQENAKLRLQLTEQKQINNSRFPDTIPYLKKHKFRYIPTHVVNTTFTSARNFFTIDKGLKDGVRPGMGVISPNGVVGEIRECSDNFCTGNLVLFEKSTLSSKIIHTEIIGTAEWTLNLLGSDPARAKLNYVGRHNKIKVGDSVVTSGNNPLYPEGIMIGRIESIKDDKQAFYDIVIRYSNDYTSLNHAYVIENNLKIERDTLEQNKANQLKQNK